MNDHERGAAWPAGDPADAARFAAKTFTSALFDCWIWTGGLTSDTGYGRFRTPTGVIGAHRWSYLAAHGPTDEPVIRHTCDVRCCVNPAHLLAGTQADNNADAVRRGRITRYALIGPNHWPALAFRLRAAARAGDADAVAAMLERPEQLALWPSAHG